MKFAAISDIHLGEAKKFKGVQRVLWSYSENVLKESVDKILDEKPAFVIQLGDLITDNNHDIDEKNYLHGIDMFKRFACPVYHVIGNHEMINLSVQDVLELNGSKGLFYSFDCENYHFIVLFSLFENKAGSHSITIDKEQLKWLAEDINLTPKKCIIFLHPSLADQSLEGNFWFESKPERCLVKNRQDVRKILANSGKILAVFNGHLHWNRMDIHDNIPYFTLSCPVENFTGEGVPGGSYAIIDLNDKEIIVDIHGNEKQKFIFIR